MRISLTQKQIFFTIAALILVGLSLWGFYSTKVFTPDFIFGSKTDSHSKSAVTPIPVESSLKLVTLSKPVFVTLPEATQEAEMNGTMQLKAGSIVRTGKTGRAELHYPNKSVTRLDFNTKIEIKQIDVNPQKSIIELIQGSIWNRVAKLLGRETFVTESATMVATVRGTAYGMSIQPDGNELVIVEEGAVGVDTPTGEEQIIRADTSFAVQPHSETAPVVEKVNVNTSADEWIQFNLNRDAQWNAEVLGDSVHPPAEKNNRNNRNVQNQGTIPSIAPTIPFVQQNPGNGNGNGNANGIGNGLGNGTGVDNGVGNNQPPAQPTSVPPTSAPQEAPPPQDPPPGNGNANDKDKNPNANGNGNAYGHDKAK